jgi:aryl-alcohol dehydrogenase-like predicted oxidoreductase
LATWACFRAKHTETDLCLRLQEVVETAKKVAGDKHRFRYIQLPFNLLMPEAFLEKWQEVKEGDKITRETLFQVAKAQKVNVITSSPLAQGLMSQVPLSSDIFKASNLGAKHLQFSRSVPAQALLSI